MIMNPSAKALLAPFCSVPRTGVTVVDLETTGFPTDEQPVPGIVSFGWADIEDGELSNVDEITLNPECEISEEAAQVHGFRNRDLIWCPTLSDAWDAITKTLSGRYIVTHNAHFDLVQVLCPAAALRGLELPPVSGIFCSMRALATYGALHIPGCSHRGPRLDAVTEYFGLKSYRALQNNQHGASIDARQTAEYLLEIFQALDD